MIVRLDEAEECLKPDLVYLPEWRLTENIFKRISANSNLTINLTLILKHKNVFGKTKWRHFSGSIQIPLKPSRIWVVAISC